jgi:hypothetical protein
MVILGISGKKQSGKNMTANYIHGCILKNKGLVEDFHITPKGELSILTADSLGNSDWGVLDITRKDADFVDYAERNIWPYVKLYSFADGLKRICVEFFGLQPAQVYGTNEEKDTPTHFFWKGMPCIEDQQWMINAGADKYMTSREFMQYFGTNVMRQIHGSIWVDHAIDIIQMEQTELAIVADVRFPNEVEAVQKVGGRVIRLTRNKLKDSHDSEVALDKENYDWKNFDEVIDNSQGDVQGCCADLHGILFNHTVD